MEQIKWPTASVWIDDTLEIFSYVKYGNETDEINKKIKCGEIFRDKKESSAQRVWGAIKARYFGNSEEKIAALSRILNSNISLQEKRNYMFIHYLEYETLFQIFLENYIHKNFISLGQKTFTQMDLDKFFEDIFENYKEYLPTKIQKGVTHSSINKVRNMLYKNIEVFGWGEIDKSRLTMKKPSLTPEWFTYLLYFYFDEKVISKKMLFNHKVVKRFLLNEYDIEYLLTGAKIKGYIEVSQLGDICNIEKVAGGLFEYAETY